MVEWIEIDLAYEKLLPENYVSTLVVEWIEIPLVEYAAPALASPPSWWSGLKLSESQ